MYKSAFPDLVLTVDDQIAEGDKVATQLRFFRRAFETRERLARPADEPSSENHLNHRNQPPPPTWRELERSVERHAAGVRAERRDANDFVVGDAKWQANVECQMLRPDCLAHPKRQLHPVTYAGAKDEAITASHLAI